MSETLQRQRARHYARVRELASFLSVAMNSLDCVNHQLDETERAGFCHCVKELRRNVDLFNQVNHTLLTCENSRKYSVCNKALSMVKCREEEGEIIELKKRDWPSCNLPVS